MGSIQVWGNALLDLEGAYFILLIWLVCRYPDFILKPWGACFAFGYPFNILVFAIYETRRFNPDHAERTEGRIAVSAAQTTHGNGVLTGGRDDEYQGAEWWVYDSEVEGE